MTRLRPRPSIRALTLIAAACALTACGGGGGGSPSAAAGAPTTLEVPSNLTYERAAARFGPRGQIRAPIDYARGMYVGDFADTWNARSFLGFDHPTLPPGAVVQRATLHVYQADVSGGPYDRGGLGELLVDHVILGDAVDAADYGDAGAIQLAVGVLSSDALLGWKTLDVTAQVRADLTSSRTRSDFRMRFTLQTNLDDRADLVSLASSDAFANNPNAPYLEIVYTTP